MNETGQTISDETLRAAGERLQGRLHILARRQQLVTAARSAFFILAAVFVVVGLLMLLDSRFELPYAVRLPVAVIAFAIMAVAVWRHIVQPWQRLNDPSSLALWAETISGIPDNLLVSATEFAADPHTNSAPDSPALRQRLLAQALAAIAPLSPKQLVPLQPALRAVGGFAIVAALVVSSVVWMVHGRGGPDAALKLLGRALAIPCIRFPHETSIDLLDTQPLVAPAGEAFALHFRLSGRVPTAEALQAGRVNVRYVVGSRASVPLMRVIGSDLLLNATIEASGPLEFQAEAGDGRTDWIAVSVVPRPVAHHIAITVIPPGYTSLPIRQLTAESPLVPAGSRLKVELQSDDELLADGSPRASAVSVAGTSPIQTYPLRSTNVQHQFTATGSGQSTIPVSPIASALVIHLRNTQGIESLPITLPLKVIPDGPPIIDLSASNPWPEMSTVQGRIRLRGSVTDDYGVRRVGLDYVVVPGDVGPQKTPTATPAINPVIAQLMSGQSPEVAGLTARYLDLPASQSPRNVSLQTDWAISSVGAKTGDTIVWWIMAEDAANNLTTSPRQAVRIADAADVQRYLTGVLGRQMETLEGGARQQQSLADDIAQLLQAGPTSRPTGRRP